MSLSDIQTAFFFAHKSMRRGSRAVLILIPFVIGLTMSNLLFFAGLFAGITKAVDSVIVNTLFSNVLIEPPPDKQYITSVDGKLDAINSIPGVVASAPHYKIGASFSFDKDKDNRNVRTRNYNVVSVEPDREANVTTIKDSIVEGRYLTENDRNEIVIGREVAGGPDALLPKMSLDGVGIGDKVTARYPNGILRQYAVVGIYKSGTDEADMTVYVTHKEMENVLGIRDAASEIFVKTADGANEGQIIETLRRVGFDKEIISTWEDFLNFTAMLRTSFDFLNFVTNFVAMLVANVTLFIIIFINVVNRRRQLGILRAIGIPESAITLTYFFQTLFAWLVGLVFSMVLVFGIIIPYFNAHPLNIGFGPFDILVSVNDVLFSASIVFITNVFAGLIPAAWAIRRETILQSIWGI